MSLNHHLPTRECASVAALLPLAAHDLLSEQEAARLQTHLATCTHCQAELALDTQIEGALRRSYAPSEKAGPLWSREEIAALLSAPEAGAAAQPARSAPPVIPGASERAARRWLGGLPALAATLVIILLAVAIFGIPGLFPGLRRGAAQLPDLSGITLTSISMVSANEGWAVGASSRALHDVPPPVGASTNGPPVILHYHNGQWTEQPLPEELNNPTVSYVLRSVSMVSASEGWAVGQAVAPNVTDGIKDGILLHYTGGRWVMANDHLGTQLQQVYMRSATDGWIVGGGQTNNPSGYVLILHYNGHTWEQVNDPFFANQPWSLDSVTEAPDGEVWIGGTWVQFAGTCSSRAPLPIMLHYDGSKWASEPVTPGGVGLLTEAMVSASDGWAVGYRTGGVFADGRCGVDLSQSAEAIIMHYQHGQWQETASFPGDGETNSFQLNWLAMVSPDEGWAVGAAGMIVHYHNGVWTRVASPITQEGGALYSVAMVSATEGWAVGNYGTILHYHNGAWSIVVSTPPRSAPTATPQLNLSQYILHGISMVSPTEGWAVGNTWTEYDEGSRVVRVDGGDPVILHYQNGRWTKEPLPDFKSHFGCSANPAICPMVGLGSIGMVSAREGWVVGSTVLPPNADGINFPILLHYTAGVWTWVDESQREASSRSFMRSATDGWMLKGFTNDGKQSIAQHYDGQSWTPVSDPLFAGIAPITLTETPDGQVWISGVDYNGQVGEDGNEPAVLLHYDGQRWSKVDPHAANARLSGLAFVSPDEGWAVGTLPNNQRGIGYEADGLILHYVNGVWQQQELFKDPLSSQSDFSFYSVAMVSPDEGWAVGDEGVILHYHNGAWGEFQNPTGQTLYNVVMVSPDEGWAVGDGVIVHYQAGSWRVYNG